MPIVLHDPDASPVAFQSVFDLEYEALTFFVC